VQAQINLLGRAERQEGSNQKAESSSAWERSSRQMEETAADAGSLVPCELQAMTFLSDIPRLHVTTPKTLAIL
jgi:hypothetical protein